MEKIMENLSVGQITIIVALITLFSFITLRTLYLKAKNKPKNKRSLVYPTPTREQKEWWTPERLNQYYYNRANNPRY